VDAKDIEIAALRVEIQKLKELISLQPSGPLSGVFGQPNPPQMAKCTLTKSFGLVQQPAAPTAQRKDVSITYL